MCSFKLLAVEVLTVGLMMFIPAMAVKGSYPGRNGKIAFSALDPEGEDYEIFVMNEDGGNNKRAIIAPYVVFLGLMGTVAVLAAKPWKKPES